MKLRSNGSRLLSRKYILISLLIMVLLGCLFGTALLKVFMIAGLLSWENVSICMIAYALLCIFFWMPLIVPDQQLADIDETSISIMPKYKSLKKIQIAWYALLNDNARPFYRVIPMKDIKKIILTYNAHWGAYGLQRFSYILKISVGDEKIKIFLNPLQNGPIFPSGHGLPTVGNFKKEDIVNLAEFTIANGVRFQDPYKLIDAMKDEHVVMYDYLVSLNKKITF